MLHYTCENEVRLLTCLGEHEMIRITEETFVELQDSYSGICLACGAFTDGGCEPDARKYKCDICGKREVYGAAELLIMGEIQFVDEADEDFGDDE